MNQLEGLKLHSVVVADSGSFNDMARFAPRDATTNPSLILKAVKQDPYAHLLAQTVAVHHGEALDQLTDRLLVRFGQEILKVVPGRVSTEVDARLSFDAAASEQRARRLIGLYEAAGIGRERVLIKLAATWEGITAARALERQGIACNLTLLFAFCQAAAAAEAGATLISPFVGRIYDWYKAKTGASWDEAANAGLNDPGVKSVTSIFHYYKRNGIKTEVMGASFRNVGQVLALAGCDLLTISPELLAALQAADGAVERRLDPAQSSAQAEDRVSLDEAAFRWQLNADAMASDKLSEGIRAFAADADQLDALLVQAKGKSR